MPFGDFPLKDKVVAVTGGGSGINFAFSRLCVQQGAQVIIADLRLTADAESFVKSHDSKSVIFTKCDVTKRTDLENIIEVSRNTYGRVPDAYVAGAGVFEPSWSNWWDDTEKDSYSQVDINLNHPLKLARIATRALLSEGKKGVVLIVASLAGYLGILSSPLYCATKHAIIGFVRSMAELDRLAGIKVTAIAPGLVQTPLWTDHPEKIKQFGYDPTNAVTPETVAEAMIELVVNGKHTGGACLEVGMGGTRSLGTWNIDPPSSSRGMGVPQEAIDRNYEPLLAIIQKERKTNAK